MRILQACVRYPPAPGGVEDHVRAVGHRLAARGHAVEVVTSDLHTETPWRRLPGGHVDDEPFPVHRHRAHAFPGEAHYVACPGMLGRVLRADADVVHGHSYGHLHNHMLKAKRLLQGVPFVLTAHYHPPWSMVGGSRRRGLRRVYDRLLGRPLLAHADAVVCVSSGEARLMEEDLGLDPSRVHVIPNGVDPARFDTPAARDDGKRFRAAVDGIDGPYVLFAGRLAVNKGLAVLVEAWRDVAKAHPDTTLVLAGEDQGLRTDLERRAGELLDADARDRLRFVGHLPEEAYLSALSGAECLVLPSEYEAFGIVLVEAMACGTPVVATRVGGVPDVVADGETGLLVPYGEPDRLAAALGDLLPDADLRREMGRAGRRRVEARFTWDAVVDRLEALYGALV